MIPMYGPPARGATAPAGRRAASHTSVSCDWYKNTHARRVLAGVLPSVYGRPATAGAALSQLLADGTIGPSETTVVVLTGHGLKAAEKIGELLGA